MNETIKQISESGQVASWAVERKSDGKQLEIWNYKNGPAYGCDVLLDDVEDWSCYGNRDLAVELFGEAVGY